MTHCANCNRKPDRHCAMQLEHYDGSAWCAFCEEAFEDGERRGAESSREQHYREERERIQNAIEEMQLYDERMNKNQYYCVYAAVIRNINAVAAEKVGR